MPDGSGDPREPQDGWWQRQKGPITFIVACALLVLGLAWWWALPRQDERPDYRLIQAGSVDPTASTPGRVVGHFIVSADARPDPQTDRSFGSGGACLVADLGRIVGGPQNCTTNTECSGKWSQYYDANVGKPKFKIGNVENGIVGFTKIGAGYCMTGQCWYRPYGGQCKRQPWRADNGKFLGPWSYGTHDVVLTETAFLDEMYPNQDLQWKVVACANRASSSWPWRDGASCGNSTGIQDPASQ